MHRYGYWVAATAVLFALSTGACGDDDDDGAAGAAGASGGAGSGGSGNVSCTPSDKGACTNATDCPKVESGEIRMAAQTCGLGCLTDADPGTCAVTCIVKETSATPGCSACYAGLVKCASEMCLAECAAAPSSAACNQCQIDKGCRSTFDQCSGLTSS
jgi:hypothetical protein